jgi:hemerythrin
MINWNELYSVEVKQIDEQHQRLFQLISDLQDALDLNHGADMLEDIYARLIDYTKSHFATEEALMKAHDYPALAPHFKEHAELKRKVVDMDKLRAEGKEKLSIDTLIFLLDWLSHHILMTDKNLGRFLNSKGIS